MKRRIAFLTMDSLEGFVCYDHLVRDVLVRRNIAVDDVSWRDQSACWDEFDAVIIRSPWDYQQAPEDFVRVLERIDHSRATLHNSLKLVRWNMRKSYLRELEAAGITIVPTVWLHSPSQSDLRSLFERLKSDQVVVKPVVGANADHAYWLNPHSEHAQFQLAEQAFRDSIALAQPFVPSIQSFGEVSLIFFGEHFSHAVLKTPKSGDFRVQEEHGGQILSWNPDPMLIEFASKCLHACPESTLYSRVDLVLLPDGSPAVMEVELIEPSLYLSYANDAPDRFADAIEALTSEDVISHGSGS